PYLPPRSGWSFQEVARRHGDYALAGVCSIVSLAGDGTIARAAVTCCGVAPTAVHARATEDALTGVEPTPDAVRQAGDRAREGVNTPGDAQAGPEYRRDLVAS